MANSSDTQEALLHNLQDAGCAPDRIEKCMAFAQERRSTIIKKTGESCDDS